MNELLWYVYQQGKQSGPFSNEQVSKMVATSMISHDAYLFKVGWKDWRPIEDTYEELGITNPPNAKTPKRRAAAPRATIKGRVIVHNDGRLTIGTGVNISASGIFVESKDNIFKVGEVLKLSVKAEGLKNAFNVQAKVVRFNSDPKNPTGYGLKFEDLDAKIRLDIQQLVDEQNAVNRKSEKIGP